MRVPGGSLVACGPAASSASVTAAIAFSSAKRSAERCSRSMTTDVSRRPRGCLGTRFGVLVSDSIEVGAEAGGVDRRGGPAGVDDNACLGKGVPPKRLERCHRDAVARDDEKLAPPSSARITSPLSLRSSRWLISRGRPMFLL